MNIHQKAPAPFLKAKACNRVGQLQNRKTPKFRSAKWENRKNCRKNWPRITFSCFGPIFLLFSGFQGFYPCKSAENTHKSYLDSRQSTELFVVFFAATFWFGGTFVFSVPLLDGPLYFPGQKKGKHPVWETPLADLSGGEVGA